MTNETINEIRFSLHIKFHMHLIVLFHQLYLMHKTDLPTFPLLSECYPPELSTKIALLNESWMKYAKKVLKIFLVINAPKEGRLLASLHKTFENIAQILFILVKFSTKCSFLSQ